MAPSDDHPGKYPWQPALALIFQGMIAVGTLTVAGLAFWGIFFTDLPQTIVRQLRTDVADAQEQLADLRRERRQLVAEVGIVKRELAGTDKRRQQALNDVQSLEAERQQFRRENELLSSERREYFRRMSEIYITALFDNIESDLRKLLVKVEMVKDYKLIVEWIEARERTKPNLKTPRTREDFEQWNAWYKEWREREPKTWYLYLLRRGPYNRSNVERGIGEQLTNDIVQQFMNEVTDAPRNSLANGSRVISRHMKGEQFSLFLERDQERMLNEIDQFVEAYSDVMALPLDVSLPVGWRAAMIPAIVAPVLDAHRRVEQLIPELRRRLVSLAGSSR